MKTKTESKSSLVPTQFKLVWKQFNSGEFLVVVRIMIHIPSLFYFRLIHPYFFFS